LVFTGLSTYIGSNGSSFETAELPAGIGLGPSWRGITAFADIVLNRWEMPFSTASGQLDRTPNLE
jgi:hypothetical protein